MNEVEARQLLAVEATASPSQLRSAYRGMLKLWHPDRFASDSASYPEAIRQTQLINAAYRLLVGDAGRQEVQRDLAAPGPVVGLNGKPIRTLDNWRLVFVVAVSVIVILGAAIDTLLRLQ